MTKKQNKLTPLLVLCASLTGPFAAAQGNASNPFPTVPEPSWVGQRFIILPQSRALQHYGYQELYTDTDKEYTPLPYQQYAGRIVRVVGIDHANGPKGEDLDEAELRLEGDNKTIFGDVDHGCMEDVASVSDLEAARKLYIGRTLWLAADHLTSYAAAKDTSDSPSSSALQEAFQKIPVKQYSPVKVIDIVPGWYASLPTRFVVQASPENGGAEGYVDVHMSDTNVPKDRQAAGRFENTFLVSDPRQKYPWPPEVWAAIEERRVNLGMTAQQIRMSWGEPSEVSKVAGQNDSEEWTYHTAPVLTLKAGVLTRVSGASAPAQ